MSTVFDPADMAEPLVLPYGNADKIAREELERIRKETPKFPRWFKATAKFIHEAFSLYGKTPSFVRHVDPGNAQYFDGGTWLPSLVLWNLERTLLWTHQGWCVEVGRAEAYAITGGNP